MNCSVSKRLLMCGIFVMMVLIGQSQVVINEFMASNSSVIDDPDFQGSGLMNKLNYINFDSQLR